MVAIHKVCIAGLMLASVTACGGGSDNEPGQGQTQAGVIEYTLPETTPQNAAQLLARASFGPSQRAIDDVMREGLGPWVENQFALKGPAHLEYVEQYSNGSGRYPRHEIWWTQAVTGPDQLRQRMAYALSQILVVSDVGYSLSNSQYGVTRYYDMLLENAFGNYRDLLNDVTRSPVMGLYLSMLQNAKGDEAGNTRADENYAREVMQLFSIGLHELNIDGTVKVQGGKPVPAYTQSDVENYARVFTGWNYFEPREWDQPLFTGGSLVDPMVPDELYHDTGVKTLIDGSQTVEGATAEQDLEAALDSLANHPNVGPFIGKQLIQKLVTSNPTPAYVERVARAFNDNGLGERGDLKAVLRAVLLDDEALNGQTRNNFGKLREPLLRMTHLWRAFEVQAGTLSEHGEYPTLSPALADIDDQLGQAPLKASSVFNFYHPDFSPQGPAYQAGLLIPEAEIYTDNNILATTTRISTQIQRLYLQNPDTTQRQWSSIDLSRQIALAENPEALLDNLNLLLLSGGMSEQLRGILLEHIALFPENADGRYQAVRDVISLIMASPDYLVQM